MEIILKYFPGLTPEQILRFEQLQALYEEWNARINVISRKDIDKLYERHVLHSLAIARFVKFRQGTDILDVGTGGGFPGIPLAIFFPEVQFHLVDSIRKKINVVNQVRTALSLDNVSEIQIRAEELNGKYDFVVSRAVTRLPEFVKWVRNNIKLQQRNAVPNGILYLKGGELSEELKSYRKTAFVQEISDWFEEDFFATKKLIHLPL